MVKALVQLEASQEVIMADSVTKVVFFSRYPSSVRSRTFSSDASAEGEGHTVGGVIVFDALVIAAGKEDGPPAFDDRFVAVEEGVAVIGGHGNLDSDVDRVILEKAGQTVPLSLQILPEGTGELGSGCGLEADAGHPGCILMQVFIRLHEVAELGLEGAGNTGGRGPQQGIQIIGIEFSRGGRQENAPVGAGRLDRCREGNHIALPFLDKRSADREIFRNGGGGKRDAGLGVGKFSGDDPDTRGFCRGLCSGSCIYGLVGSRWSCGL